MLKDENVRVGRIGWWLKPKQGGSWLSAVRQRLAGAGNDDSISGSLATVRKLRLGGRPDKA
jgi:hypothetical protein